MFTVYEAANKLLNNSFRKADERIHPIHNERIRCIWAVWGAAFVAFLKTSSKNSAFLIALFLIHTSLDRSRVKTAELFTRVVQRTSRKHALLHGKDCMAVFE